MEEEKQLQSDNLVKKVEILRTMTAEQVQAKIKQQCSLQKFQFLQAHGRKLDVASHQLVNGDELIESATKRNENRVYIAKLPDKTENVVCDFVSLLSA